MAAADITASGSGGIKVALRRRLARTARRLQHGRPTLSVIVLAAGDDPVRLHATLSSIRDQPSPAIEIVVVSYDGGEPAARAAAGDDTRARFLRAGNVDEARMRGVRSSRGRFVVVATPGDVYPPRVLAHLIEGIEPDRAFLLSTGFLVRRPFTLPEVPGTAANPYLGRLLMPRDRVLTALRAGGDPDPDGFLVALRLLRGEFRPSGWESYRDVRAEAPGPFVARRDPFPGLAARVARDRASIAGLADLDIPRAARARGAMAALRPFLNVADAATDEQWAELSRHAAAMNALVDPSRPGPDVVANALAVLAAGGHRDHVVALASAVDGADLATVKRDGRVIAVLPVPPGLLTDDDLEVSLTQTQVRARVRRMVLDGAVVRLEILIGVHHLAQAETDIVQIELANDVGPHPMRVQVGSDLVVTRWMAEAEQDHDSGLIRAELDLSDLPSALYTIGVLWSDGELERAAMVTELAPTGSAGRSPVLLPDGRSVGLHLRHGRVGLAITAAPDRAVEPVLSRVEVDGDKLRLTTERSVDRVWLEGNGRRIAGLAGTPGFWTIPLLGEVFGLDALPLPTGSYRLVFERAGSAVPAVAASGVIDLLPAEFRTALHRVQLQRGPDDRVGVRLDPLLRDDEIGRRAQRRLQVEFSASTAPLDPRLIYFQSFTGQWANDNPLAIQAELTRLRPDLDLRWVVADSSASAPPGTTPLLFRSREWYDVMTRASYLVTNIELEKWFRRRPGQQVLQTFHGYPSKAMGLGLWEPRGLAPHEIRSQLERTSGVWNTLVTPTEEMDQYYRRDYAYDGRILSSGYPRNDVLVGQPAEDLRSQTRDRLGIRPGQRAILYAPTWRDDLATNFRAAEAVHHLDVGEASAALGDDYVLLMRGHRFHAPTAGSGSQVIDVTGYPDINHLIVASDAAVLDYSSLRFDFALTGRPMVFLVPDLESYGSRVRGFLWDYRETAPGPLVATTAEVVTMLRDLEGLAARSAAELAAFNARYNVMHDGHAAERVVAEFFADLVP